MFVFVLMKGALVQVRSVFVLVKGHGKLDNHRILRQALMIIIINEIFVKRECLTKIELGAL